jgi:uncharacterized membrane protein YgcG
MVTAVWRVLAVALLLAATASIGSAQALTTPQRTGWVTDEAGILDPELESVLARRLMELQRRRGAEIVVVTLQSLQGASIETWGDLLGESWTVGRSEGKDNGALLIVAPNERKVRIAVGYGLSHRLSDSAAVAIIADDILPFFRRGDFAGGIDSGVSAIFAQVDLRAAIKPPATSTDTPVATAKPELERSTPIFTPTITPAPTAARQKSDVDVAFITTCAVVILAVCLFIFLFLRSQSHVNVAVSTPARAKDDNGTDTPMAATTAPTTHQGDDDFQNSFLGILLSNMQNNSTWGNSGWSATRRSSSGSSWSSRASSSASSRSFGGSSSSSSSGSHRSFGGASSSSSSSGSRRSFGGGSSGSSSSGSRRSFGGGASGSW